MPGHFCRWKPLHDDRRHRQQTKVNSGRHESLVKSVRGAGAEHDLLRLSKIVCFSPNARDADVLTRLAKFICFAELTPRGCLGSCGRGSPPLRVPPFGSLETFRTRALRAIRECDALLRTTLYDGDALSVREALDMGTPVIATDNGMRPGGCRLIPVSDEGALEAAIEETLAGGRRGAAPESAGEANLAALLEVYRRLLGLAI